MLILARNIGQKIMIGNDIQVVITDISNRQVKVGIVAPRDIEVHREEIFDRINEDRFGNWNK